MCFFHSDSMSSDVLRSVDSLQRLHRKAKIVDASFDDRIEITTRSVWAEVRDNIDRGVYATNSYIARSLNMLDQRLRRDKLS